MKYISIAIIILFSISAFSQGGKLIPIKISSGPRGPQGIEGEAGISIDTAYVTGDSLYIKLTDATIITAGYVKGADGSMGVDGAPGADGADGVDGIDGIDGVDGIDGAPGSVWRDGTGAPSNALGIDGDYYLNDANGDVYYKSGGTYSIVANMKGLDGIGSGTVTVVTGSSPIIITSTATTTPNVTLDTTSATGAATQYDLTLKENKLIGNSGQTLRFSGTNTVSASSFLYNNGSSIGINNTSPSGSLTVNGSSYFNSQTPFSLYNASGTGIYTSFQDGANLDNLVYSGTRKTFTLGYTSGGGLGISDIANKKLHVNGGISVGEGIYNTAIDANSLIVEGSAIVQTRSGTATGLAGYDVNSKFANMTLGSGFSITSGTLNNLALTSLGGQTGTTQTFAYGQSGTTPSWSSGSNVHTFRLPTATIGQLLVHSGTDWIAATPAYLTTLNGITNATQTFATGTSGTNFNISSSGTTHTFNFPNSSGSNRGLLTSTDWTTFNNKMTSWLLAASGTGGTSTITDGTTVTITAGTGMTATRSSGNITVATTALLSEVDGSITNEGYTGVTAGGATSSVLQGYNSAGTATGSGTTINVAGTLSISETTSTNGGQVTITGAATDLSFTNVTSPPTAVTLASSTGGDVIFVAGTGVSLTGSSSNTMTITNQGDLLVTNEGSLTVGAGSSTTSTIVSNTTGSTDVTIEAGTGLGISESGSTITLVNKDAYASMVNTTETFNLSATTPKKLDFGDTDPVTAVGLTTSLTDNWVTIATTGTYEVTVSGSFESAASSSVYTFGLRKDNSGTDTQVGIGQYLKSPTGTVPVPFTWINSFNANDRVYTYIESSANTTGDIMRYLRMTIKRIY